MISSEKPLASFSCIINNSRFVIFEPLEFWVNKYSGVEIESLILGEVGFYILGFDRDFSSLLPLLYNRVAAVETSGFDGNFAFTT